MAKDIAIWPGSSSFHPGETPFGIYDYDTTFQKDAVKTADWCAKRLGYPIVDVELQEKKLPEDEFIVAVVCVLCDVEKETLEGLASFFASA